jgi:5-methylcytosine-specific restriction endonuclease McrA
VKTGNQHGSKWIRPVKRLAIYIRDGFACAYCGRDLRGAAKDQVTLDHLRCRVNGGSNEASNLVTACLRCNSQRGDTPWRQYATGGAVDRIQRLVRRKLNMELAQALMDGTAGNPQAEAAR